MRKAIKTLTLLLTTAVTFGTTNLSAQNLVITEIMNNPPESGTDTTEFIEIYNKGTVPIDMTGFTLTGGIYTFPNVTIPANGFYVVAINASAFNNTYGFAPDGVFINGLSNAGESIVLTNASGVTLDSVRYFNAAPWPATTANGGGASIVLCDFNSDNNIGSNWATETIPVGIVINSFNVLASPKMANSCFSAAVDVEATEFLNLSSNYCQTSTITGSFVISNVLSTTANNIQYTVTADGSTILSNSIASLPGMDSDTITLGPIPVLTGITNLVVYTSLMGDNNSSNDTISMTVAISNITASVNVTDSILCNGSSNGEVMAIGSDGLGSLYNYQWDGATGNQTTAVVSGLEAGTYTVTVTDSIGCAAVAAIVLSEPTAINAIQDSITNVSCFGGNDGAAMITINGGTPGYTFLWSNGATTEDITGLSAGTYTVTVTDSLGCAAIAAIVLSEPTAINAIQDIITNVSCFGGNDGAAMMTINGGTPSYTFLWSNGSTSEDITGLSAGTYTVTVTDSLGCTAVAAIVLSEPTAIYAIQDIITNVSCFGGNDGAAMITINGGTPGYTYLWSNGSTTEDITGLSAGTYTGTVTDANGCTANTAVVITSPSLLIATAMNNADGTATASGSGGTSPYTYIWDASANNQTTATATGLTSNTNYVVTVTDANGCIDTASVLIVFVGVEEETNLSKLNIFPNPTNGNVFIALDLIEYGSVEITLTDAVGKILIKKELQNILSEQITLQTEELPSGFYTIKLRIGSEQLTKKLVISKY